MRVLTISWDQSLDNTKITYNQQFSESHWIVRADVLQDAIGMLTDKYYAIFTEKGRSGYGKTVDELRGKVDQDNAQYLLDQVARLTAENAQYLLDQVARLTAENAMLKEKAFNQPEQQEPVAWKDNNYGNLHHQDWGNSIPLYTAPPKQEALSDAEVEQITQGNPLLSYLDKIL